jgi:hypothetical protein
MMGLTNEELGVVSRNDPMGGFAQDTQSLSRAAPHLKHHFIPTIPACKSITGKHPQNLLPGHLLSGNFCNL